jgi:hypothetical protein
MTLDINVAPDQIISSVIQLLASLMMWLEEHFWNFSVPGRVDIFNPIDNSLVPLKWFVETTHNYFLLNSS